MRTLKGFTNTQKCLDIQTIVFYKFLAYILLFGYK